MGKRSKITSLALALALVLGAPAAAGVAADQRTGDGSCSRKHTKKMVRAFIRAFNHARADRLDALWAPEPDFQWYFVDDEREQEAEDRPTLRLYFEQRVLLNDRLRLRSLGVGKDGTGFAFKLVRRTEDDRDGAAGVFHGKGATGEVLMPPSITAPIPKRACLFIVWAMDRHRE